MCAQDIKEGSEGASAGGGEGGWKGEDVGEQGVGEGSGAWCYMTALTGSYCALHYTREDQAYLQFLTCN